MIDLWVAETSNAESNGSVHYRTNSQEAIAAVSNKSEQKSVLVPKLKKFSEFDTKGYSFNGV